MATRSPQETGDALDAVAQQRRRNGAEIVREAVDAFLARQADYAIALDSPGDPTDAAVDAEPLWRKIECPGD